MARDNIYKAMLSLESKARELRQRHESYVNELGRKYPKYAPWGS